MLGPMTLTVSHEQPTAVRQAPTSAPPALVPDTPFAALLLSAGLTALLLWLCYFPVAWGWLGWVALVPLLVLVRARARARRVYGCAWLAGLAFFWPAIQWMRVAD